MPHVDEQFFNHIKACTEEKWRDLQPLTFEEFLGQAKTTYIWQKETRWLGLTEAEIDALETKWRIRFPSDYRLFLKILHCIDKPITIATYDGDIKQIVPHESILFHNWQKDTNTLENAYQQIIDDISYDVLHNNIWMPGWGRKPITKFGQRQQIEALIANAPKLIPVYGHRFLLTEPYAGEFANPVLSIYHADATIYTANLYQFLCKDFPDLLEMAQKDVEQIFRESQRLARERQRLYQSIPFWGALL